MITDQTKQEIEFRCRDICERFHLQQVYLAQVLGPRRHYVAGYGQTVPGRPQQLTLTEDLALFWHGALPATIREIIRQESKEWGARVQGELAAMDVAARPDPAHSDTKKGGEFRGP